MGDHKPMSVIEKAEQAIEAFDHDDWIFDRENVGKPFEWCWQLRTEYGGTPVYIVCSDRYAKEERWNDVVAQAVADFPEIARALLAENKRLRAALERIACRHQSLDLLWWQEEAREALKGGNDEEPGNHN